uniref:Uncharacterized protein n=1 Tax=Anguilla anguilla TaxID=7936 RepID=A0A0E9X0A7_ANGAN
MSFGSEVWCRLALLDNKRDKTFLSINIYQKPVSVGFRCVSALKSDSFKPLIG